MTLTSRGEPLLVAICLLSLVSHLPSLHGDFVFDDHESILKNGAVTGAVSVARLFSLDYWGRPIRSASSHKSYRPLTTLSFRWNYALHGLHTTGYHAVNLALHSLVCLLVWTITRKLLPKRRETADATALLFASHPVHCEAVANITGRAELMMALFVLLSVRSHLHGQAIRKYVFASVSILCKEQGIVAVPICMLLDGWRRFSIRSFLFVGVTVLTRWRISSGSGVGFSALDNPAAALESSIWKMISFVWNWLEHVRLLVWPHPLCFDYSMGTIPPITSLKDERLPLLLAAIVAALLVAVRLYRNHLFRLGVLLGAVPFFPASNIAIPVGFTVAERVLYLPSLGFCLLLATLINYAAKSPSSSICRTKGMLYVVLTVYVSLSWKRSSEWASELSLYGADVQRYPQNPKIHYNLAKTTQRQGAHELAEQHYRKSIQLYPEYVEALNNLANILEARRQSEEAERLLRRAIEARPEFGVAHHNLGRQLTSRGNFTEARVWLDRAIRLRPSSSETLFSLCTWYFAQQLQTSAEQCWTNVTRLDENHHMAWTNLLITWHSSNRCHLVVPILRRLERLFPQSTASLHSQLGVCLAELRLLAEAEPHLRLAARLEPLQARHLTNLDALHRRQRRAAPQLPSTCTKGAIVNCSHAHTAFDVLNKSSSSSSSSQLLLRVV